MFKFFYLFILPTFFLVIAFFGELNLTNNNWTLTELTAQCVHHKLKDLVRTHHIVKMITALFLV